MITIFYPIHVGHIHEIFFSFWVTRVEWERKWNVAEIDF